MLATRCLLAEYLRCVSYVATSTSSGLTCARMVDHPGLVISSPVRIPWPHRSARPPWRGRHTLTPAPGVTTWTHWSAAPAPSLVAVAPAGCAVRMVVPRGGSSPGAHGQRPGAVEPEPAHRWAADRAQSHVSRRGHDPERAAGDANGAGGARPCVLAAHTRASPSALLRGARRCRGTVSLGARGPCASGFSAGPSCHDGGARPRAGSGGRPWRSPRQPVAERRPGILLRG